MPRIPSPAPPTRPWNEECEREMRRSDACFGVMVIIIFVLIAAILVLGIVAAIKWNHHHGY